MPVRDDRNLALRDAADLLKARQENADGSRKIARAAIPIHTLAPGSAADAVGSGPLDNVAVWVNEGGAVGGHSMKALRTLVVEDDLMIGGLLAETLEGLGHKVCAVETNVAKAVAAASHWRPDLMIVDVGRGEATGVAVVKEILRNGFVPHVVVTGDAAGGARVEPETVLIRKPFRVSALEQAIQRALVAEPLCDRGACADYPGA